MDIILEYINKLINYTSNRFEHLNLLDKVALNGAILLLLTFFLLIPTYIYDKTIVFEFTIKENYFNLSYFFLVLIFISYTIYLFIGKYKLLSFFLLILLSSFMVFIYPPILSKYFQDEYFKYYYKKVNILFENKEDGKTVNMLKNLINLMDNFKDENLEFYIEVNLALANKLYTKDELKDGIYYFHKALDSKTKVISQKIEKKLNVEYLEFEDGVDNQLFLLNHNGIKALKKQDYKTALKHFEQAFDMFLKDEGVKKDNLLGVDSIRVNGINNLGTLITLSFNIGNTLFKLNSFEESYEYFLLAIDASYNNTNVNLVSKVFQGIIKKSIINTDFEEDDFAFDNFNLLLVVTTSFENILKKINNIKKVDLKLQKDKSLIESNKHNNINNANLHFVNLYLAQADSYFEIENFEEAIKYYSKALIVALEMKNIYYIIHIHNKLGLVDEKLNKLKEAVDEYKLVEYYLINLDINNKYFYSSNHTKFLENNKNEKIKLRGVVDLTHIYKLTAISWIENGKATIDGKDYWIGDTLGNLEIKEIFLEEKKKMVELKKYNESESEVKYIIRFR